MINLKVDPGLKILLDLNGEILVQNHGYWIKIEAWEKEPTAATPFGIRYSLTLHAPDGQRVLGFDNAHQIKSGKRQKYRTKRTNHDHKHLSNTDPGTPYEFETVTQLLNDFFSEVDQLLKELTP